MLDAIVRALLLSAIFASVFIAGQLVVGGLWQRRAAVGAINRRLGMIRSGSSRDEIVTRLRKNAPREFAELPGVLAGPLRKAQRMLMASAVPCRRL